MAALRVPWGLAPNWEADSAAAAPIIDNISKKHAKVSRGNAGLALWAPLLALQAKRMAVEAAGTLWTALTNARRLKEKGKKGKKGKKDEKKRNERKQSGKEKLNAGTSQPTAVKPAKKSAPKPIRTFSAKSIDESLIATLKSEGSLELFDENGDSLFCCNIEPDVAQDARKIEFSPTAYELHIFLDDDEEGCLVFDLAKRELRELNPHPYDSINEIKRMPVTRQLYFKDTHQSMQEVRALSVIKQDGNIAVVTEKTIFHPQGGGQPSDVGVMTGESGTVFRVTKVVRDRDTKVILHWGSFSGGDVFETGERLTQRIEMKSRLLHARLHSAGHLIDVAMDEIGVKLKPSKGYHFPSGPYVEYIGRIDAKEKQSVIEKLQKSVEVLIAKDIKTVVTEKESKRFVMVGSETIGCPCGGTHVKSSGEILKLTIVKLKNVKKNTRVSYRLV
mmetsp:Transcript_22166/g.33034  ORF Transcript_22166/g.33034 Transcript_22166/m.33034 type:complete len:446 (+) Transcript_22166:97-1434(+)